METTRPRDEHDHEDEGRGRCPRCRMREGLTAAIGHPSGEYRQILLDQLLDTVEKLRAVDATDEDDEEHEEVVVYAAEEAIELGDCLAQLAGIAYSDD
jgi:hypothetical protein